MLIDDILLFLTPFALYGLYVVIARRTEAAKAAGHPVPWIPLFAAGLGLMVIGILVFAAQEPQSNSAGAFHSHRDMKPKPVPPPETY